MRDTLGITTALIFRSPAIFLIEAVIRSKNKRLENFTLIGTQRVLLTPAILISLVVYDKCGIIRPFGLL